MRKRTISTFTLLLISVLSIFIGAQTKSTKQSPTSTYIRVGYYTQWAAYEQLKLSDMVKNGMASTLTHIQYAFAAIDPSGTCTITADGLSDSYADYTRAFDSASSVSGVADTSKQPLRGNFNQLKQLKAKYPNLKVLISIGGGTGSKYFSDVALNATARNKFVSSCIDIYIKGNLPKVDNAGGSGVAAGIFDGIDVDWEYPASEDGAPGNHFSPEDTQTFTLLLKEFRKQLDAYGAKTNKRYSLTAATTGVPSRIAQLEVKKISAVLDWIGIMTYDFKGSWNGAGPTDFHSNLYADTSKNPYSGQEKNLSVANSVDTFMKAGAPANKILIGIPYYGRGWTGVKNKKNGLYQTATGPAKGGSEEGLADYNVILKKKGTVYFDKVAKQTYKFDGKTWWSYDNTKSIAAKIEYVRQNKLAGTMVWDLAGDSSTATLSKAIYNGLTRAN